MAKKESQRIIKYFSSPINLQNGRQQILYLLEIADFSHGIEFIFKAFFGQYNLRTIFLYSHWRKQRTDIQRERKRMDKGLKLKVSTVDNRIK